MKRYFSYLRITYFIFLLIGFPLSNSQAQSDSLNAVTTERKVEVNQAVREELHRYMGYEDLLPRYLSLPYDISMNTNIGGPYVDIGYLLLMFVPILIFFMIRDKWLKIITGLLLTLFLIISMATGYSAHHQIEVEEINKQLTTEWKTSSFSATPLKHFKLNLTSFANGLYQPIHRKLVNTISGEGDYITYPLCIVLFLVLFFVLKDSVADRPIGEKALIYFSLLYGFLWWLLGAGIFWYGILILPLGLILMSVGFFRRKSKNDVLKYTFISIVAFCVLNSLLYRFSNYNQFSKEEEVFRGAIHAAPLLFGLGERTEQEVIDFLYPGYATTVNIINNDPDALILRIGTYFQYFIERNNERVREDNQVSYFSQLVKAYQGKENLSNFLKSQGYKYLIIDFNAATIDYTPEGSLKEKVMLIQEYISNNPALELIGTDRVVVNSAGQQVYSIYGRELVNSGTFAAFRIN